MLRSVLIDYLTEVALLVEQAHANYRDTEVAGGLELIACHVPESARVDGERLA